MDIIAHKVIFLTVSGILVAASVAAIAIFGFRPGIDFSGGTLWEVRFTDNETGGTTAANLTEALAELGVEQALVTTGQTASDFLIRARELTEEDHQAAKAGLTESLGVFEELSFETIGSTVGGELASRALKAFIFVIIGISLYIAFAFRKVSRPVRSWQYGVTTLVTLFHDAAIPAGLFALLGRYQGVEVGTSFIVALLVVMGFSVHDTIVVFDRIRENIKGAQGGKPFAEVVNDSVLQTMARSVNTSLTLILVLVALFFFGSPVLSYFILAIAVGTIVGTYSSVFVASPLLTLWKRSA
ncbi:MAG: protein translocase subunit SecF [Candidatus Colwellbacteria bacterium]|nr:protein translocase subunit SecF [Candidatus Colwellbacteria bacterium]